MRHHLGRGALGHDPAAVHPGARTQIDHVVGLAYRVFIVLDHDHGVAEIAQVHQRVEQALVVALVQADGRLVQDVHDPHQPGADLARQTDALGFAARQGIGGAVQREVTQPNISQKAQSVANFLDDLHGDLTAPALERKGGEEVDGPRHGELRHLGHAPAVDEHVAGRAVQACSRAVGTGARRAVLRQLLAHGGGFGLLEAPLEVLDDAFEGVFAPGGAALAVEIFEFDLFIVAAEQDQVLDFSGQ